MLNLDMVNLEIVWLFLIYAFLGWCVEVVYAALESGQFVNRGFLNGPLCPIYGFGVLLVIHILAPVQDNILLMFAGAVLITSAIELIGGFVLEKAFHHRWWDYSDMPFNIGGYICLRFSLAWGLACLLVVDRIHPLIVNGLSLVPVNASQVLLSVLAMVLLVDTISTVKAVLKLNHHLEIIDEMSQRIREASDILGESLASSTLAVVHTGNEMEANLAAQKLLLEENIEAGRALLEEGLETRRILLEESKGKWEERLEYRKELLEADLAQIRQIPRMALEHQKASLARQKRALLDLQQHYRELLDVKQFDYQRLLKAFPGLHSLRHTESMEKMRLALFSSYVAGSEWLFPGEKARDSYSQDCSDN